MVRCRSRAIVAVAITIVVIGVFTLGGSAVRADQDVTHEHGGGAPHISIIGDSTLAGVRWYEDYGALDRFNFVMSAESCRRTIEQSCISREGYRSANVITAMRSLDGQLGEVLVVMSGYNDPISTIDEAIAGVVDEARDQDVGHVVWLTLRTSSDVEYHDPQDQSSINTFRAYNEQLVAAADASDGFLQVADWATYSNGASAWFAYDGVHLTPQGVDGVTTYIAAIVERVIAGEDVSPAAAPWTVLVPGAAGDTVAAVQDAVIAAGIELRGGVDGAYGNDTMAAVAEYQRRDGDLQVTGAVDMATARALGVYEEPGMPSSADPAPMPVTVTAQPATSVAAAPVATNAGRSLRWPFIGAGVVAALAGAVVLRRRHVVAQRNVRRRARIHPAASPRRSIADLRRAGDLPARDLVDQPAGSRVLRSSDMVSNRIAPVSASSSRSVSPPANP